MVPLVEFTFEVSSLSPEFLGLSFHLIELCYKPILLLSSIPTMARGIEVSLVSLTSMWPRLAALKIDLKVPWIHNLCVNNHRTHALNFLSN